MEPILLEDGTKLVPLDPKEMEACSKEIEGVLDKYNARYLPVIEKLESLQETKQIARLWILKVADDTETPKVEVKEPIKKPNTKETKEEDK